MKVACIIARDGVSPLNFFRLATRLVDFFLARVVTPDTVVVDITGFLAGRLTAFLTDRFLTTRFRLTIMDPCPDQNTLAMAIRLRLSVRSVSTGHKLPAPLIAHNFAL